MTKNNLPSNYSIKNALIPSISLFTSMGTLICCALPALFVTIGAGATLAGIVSAAPWLVALSKYKVFVFGFAGVMIIVAGGLMYNARNAPCPADAKQAAACKRLRKFSLVIYVFSVLVFLTGVFFAFIAPRILI
jgi:hypothetical protein